MWWVAVGSSSSTWSLLRAVLYLIVEGVLFPAPEPAEDVEPEFGTLTAVCKERKKT